MTIVVVVNSTWIDIINGVPQGAVLGSLLFNIYINDLFFSEEFQMANFADDCTPYDFGNNTDEVLNKLEEQSILLIEWYKYNYLKPNPDKWHLILSERGSNSYLNINGKYIFNRENEKILGVYFDNKLNFDYHINKLCKKASQKLHALARVSVFMSCRQKKQIMNAFITSQFGYCQLIWMFHNRKMLKQINRIHERTLRIVYADNNSSFEDLLEKSGPVSMHDRNLQQMAIEMYKSLNDLSSTHLSELFSVKERKYNLRNDNALVSNIPHSTKYGLNTISHLAPKIWEIIPNEIKSCKSLNSFEAKINMWVPTNCPCNLCRPYVYNVGFI